MVIVSKIRSFSISDFFSLRESVGVPMLYFIKKLLEVISKTEDDEDKYNVIYALDKLGKYWKLDKDDADHVDFSKIIPPSFEPSDDITLVKGVVKIENIDEYRKCLRQRLGVTTKNIQDAQIIEFSDGESA